MLDPHTDLKVQVAEARRNQILAGAAQIFAQKGYHKATTREIAQAAGISEGTIYNYFSNKRELLLAMAEALATESFKSIVRDDPPDDPQHFLTIILRDRFQLIEKNGHLIAPLVAEVFSDASLREELYQQILRPITMLMEQYIQHQINLGRFRPVNPAIVTRALMGSLILNSVFKLSGLEPQYDVVSTEAMIDELVALILDGISAED
jgi:AcrR family transcriptional regulator